MHANLYPVGAARFGKFPLGKSLNRNGVKTSEAEAAESKFTRSTLSCYVKLGKDH